jgi:hypothetical protein
MASVSHRLDHAAIQRILRSPTGPVARDMLRRGRNVERVAKRLTGVDTGRLRASINTEQVYRFGAPGARIGSRVKYARVHHEGHGIIRPVRAKALRFKPKGSATWVFAMRVRAVAGTKYLTRALPFARG